MSKFLTALERAEQERALWGDAAPSETRPEPNPAPPETAPSGAPGSSPDQAERVSDRLDDQVSDRLDDHLVSLLAPRSFEAEQYRVLRHRIEQLHKLTDLSAIAISSPSMSEGKTTTAINLAGALAMDPNAHVLLVDADLRAPAVATQLALEDRDRPGLVDAILDPHLTLTAVTQASPHLNLAVVPVGRVPSAPYEILKSHRFVELLSDARARYDYIILDTPPLVSIPDCQLIGKLVDGFLIVVAAHRTTRQLLSEALDGSDLSKILGLVFNGDDCHGFRGYGYYSGGRPSTRSRGYRW